MPVLLRRLVLACALTGATLVPLTAQVGPAPAETGLDPDLLALACAPRAALEAPPPVPLRVTGGQDSHARDVFVPGDLVTINAGETDGIDIGQEFFVRRFQAPEGPMSASNPGIIRTAGWIRVWAVDDELSLATITHACDTVVAGDYLEPLELPALVVPDAATIDGEPQRENYGRVLVGNDHRRAFARGDFFLVDRGSDHGVEAGSNFVVYRNRGVPENFLFELGEAVAVRVGPTVSTLQMTASRDGVLTGDYVAIRLPEDD